MHGMKWLILLSWSIEVRIIEQRAESGSHIMKAKVADRS